MVPGELTRPPAWSPGTWEGSLGQSPASRHTLPTRWHTTPPIGTPYPPTRSSEAPLAAGVS